MLADKDIKNISISWVVKCAGWEVLECGKNADTYGQMRWLRDFWCLLKDTLAGTYAGLQADKPRCKDLRRN
jgi:hypothetical protein